jgi:hypothetical protein
MMSPIGRKPANPNIEWRAIMLTFSAVFIYDWRIGTMLVLVPRADSARFL